jgi:hypothetical protein
MFSFKHISVNQIIVFSEIIAESTLLDREFIERRYLDHCRNFSDTIEFLREIGLIGIGGSKIVAKAKYKAFLKEFQNSDQPREMVCNCIVAWFLDERTYLYGYLGEYLSHFRLKNGKYEFRPKAAERLRYSDVRNFLMDLRFLYLDTKKSKYIITDHYSLIYAESKAAQVLSPDEFMEAQKRREKIGKAAEIRIVKYERERLAKFPDLVKKIEYIAVTDVMAGYDIKSFEGEFDEGRNPVPRFIEVKAVSPLDYRFYWTRNEIEKSELYGQRYHLYLLPVLGKHRFDIKNLKIIQSPYSSVYKDKSTWNRTEELVAFSLSKDLGKQNLQASGKLVQ